MEKLKKRAVVDTFFLIYFFVFQDLEYINNKIVHLDDNMFCLRNIILLTNIYDSERIEFKDSIKIKISSLSKKD